MSKRNTLSLAGLLALMVILTSCFYQCLSWSPDGRYLAFAAGEIGKLWRWDSQKGSMEAINLSPSDGASEVSGNIKSCGYLPSGDRIVALAEKEKKASLYLLDPSRADKNTTTVAENVSLAFDISRQGNIYYVKEDKEKKDFALWEYGQGHNKPIWRNKQPFDFPRTDPAGKQALFSMDRSLGLLDLDRGTSRTLVNNARPGQKENKGVIHWSLWVNEHRVLYIAEEQELWGELVALNLDDLTTRSLMKGVSAAIPPSLSPDLKRITVTAAWRDAAGNITKEAPAQIASVNLDSEKWEWLTDEIFGASYSAFAPDGQRLAYLASVAKVGGPMLLKILDLKSKRETIAWRNEEERLYASAMALQRAGDPVLAVNQLKDLLDRFPNTPYKPLAVCQGIQFILQPQYLNLDFAYALLKEVSTPGDIISQRLRDAFWRPEDRLATDPAEDWINTYATDASRKEWKFNTDLARDLRAVWVRVGQNRIYIRVDYGSAKDLLGITLQDTQLLFDYGDPQKGERRISPGAQWDRGAKRQVLVRHWFEAAEKSQYDLEITGEKGETLSRYLASGFAPPANPLFAIVDLYQDQTGSVVYAIDRKMLGLEPGQKVNLQVCTYKGGIDKFEHPRQASGCDVADAFGPENTPERIREEMKSSPGGGHPNCVIKGAAGSFVVLEK
jgi:hypothetical protein